MPEKIPDIPPCKMEQSGNRIQVSGGLECSQRHQVGHWEIQEARGANSVGAVKLTAPTILLPWVLGTPNVLGTPKKCGTPMSICAATGLFAVPTCPPVVLLCVFVQLGLFAWCTRPHKRVMGTPMSTQSATPVGKRPR